ncbi:hypothetical protein W911_15165 [Hyphomicrobium nitrativorans NL23]|uniref:Uncharacterized protein n=1 Tax=Hyphomicrobium nitrativorans NL23 TaxID=1029756 RepID=V5SHP6_9HYPH|nr:hypothetical protein W911_15165 [Hyphomicrobium nitrativorans NL23]
MVKLFGMTGGGKSGHLFKRGDRSAPLTRRLAPLASDLSPVGAVAKPIVRLIQRAWLDPGLRRDDGIKGKIDSHTRNVTPTEVGAQTRLRIAQQLPPG